MKDKLFKEMKVKMSKTVEALQNEFSRLRTGRASITILDGITVDYYGTRTPLNQVATLSTPESRLIVIQPWDITQIQIIEKAVLASDLGLTPMNDGKLIRIHIPQLTEERRKELVKVAKRYAEECRVSIRNTRREVNDSLKRLEKEEHISEDEIKKAQQDVQKETDREIELLDEVLQTKEKEIMEV